MQKLKLDKHNTAPYPYQDKTVLLLSDLHAPYHHPDSLAFLKAVKNHYEPDLVVSVGDLADFHGISFHDSDPDLDSAGLELEKLQDFSGKLEKLFPDLYIVGSNHGDLPLRKALSNGLPREIFRPFNEIYGVGEGWKFLDDLTLKDPLKKEPDLYICHSIKKNALQVAQQRGQRFVCGHYHESFEISYCGNPNELLWAMIVGCLIDKKSRAFAYNQLNLNRPIIGTGVVENGYPTLLPMVLNKEGKWTGRIK